MCLRVEASGEVKAVLVISLVVVVVAVSTLPGFELAIGGAAVDPSARFENGDECFVISHGREIGISSHGGEVSEPVIDRLE